jgi:hypothetical protein
VSMPAPAVLTLSTSSDDEQRLIEQHLGRLSVVNAANSEARDFYDGSRLIRDLGISTPPSMTGLRVVAGWPGTVVDVLEERLDWLGWSSTGTGDDFGLGDVYAANELGVESGMGHLDALIFGLSFVTVGTGDTGEPSPLVTPSSPMTTTGIWDPRARRLSSACSALLADNLRAEVTLYGPDETATFTNDGGIWRATNRDVHRLGRVPVVLIPNRARGSRQIGRSEITRAVRYYTEAAGRTLRGLEVNREFYNAPQRIGLNIAEEMFQNPDGQPVNQWTAIQGRMLMIPPSDDPEMPSPDMKQFSPASPAPYVDQIRGYATLLAAEAGIPAAYLGFQTDNPASADAIRAGEARLVKRAERRQATFGRAWREVGRLALLMRDGTIPDTYDTQVVAKWRDASTPTRAAAADEASKLVAAGVLPADSSVTMDRIGLSPAEQQTVAVERRRSLTAGLVDKLTSTPLPPVQPPAPGTTTAAATQAAP